MKPLLSLIITLLLGSHGAAGQEDLLAPSTVAVRIAKGDKTLEEELRTLSVKEADEILRDTWKQTAESQPATADAALKILGNLPGMEERYRNGTLETPHLKENGSLRSTWMRNLRRIPTRWALNLMGDLLLDPRPMTSNMLPDQVRELEETGQLSSAMPNTLYAAAGMGSMGLRNWPLRKDPNSYTDADVAKVQAWWREHSHEPDSFFFGDVAQEQGAIAPPMLQNRPKTSAKDAVRLPLENSTNVASVDSDHLLGWVVLCAAAVALLIWLAWRSSRRAT